MSEVEYFEDWTSYQCVLGTPPKNKCVWIETSK